MLYEEYGCMHMTQKQDMMKAPTYVSACIYRLYVTKTWLSSQQINQWEIITPRTGPILEKLDLQERILSGRDKQRILPEKTGFQVQLIS